MTDPLTLADLQVIETRLLTEPDRSLARFEHRRPATREDFIEVGKSLGGEVVTVLGSYLIIPIEEAE